MYYVHYLHDYTYNQHKIHKIEIKFYSEVKKKCEQKCNVYVMQGESSRKVGFNRHVN